MTARTPLRSSTLLALVLLLTGSMVVAAQSGSATGQSTRLPRALRALQERPEDPEALMARLMRDAMQALVGPEQDGPGSSGEDDDWWWDDDYAEVYLRPAGDLDTDGVPDAVENRWFEIETEEDFVEGSSAAAVRGTDGGDLWSKELGDYGFMFPAGDLDGEPGDDVFVLSEERLPTPGYFWAGTIAGTRGRDGSPLWTRSFQNSFNYVVTSLGLWLDHFDFTYPVALADDATGDGRSDLLLARYQGAFAYLDVAETGTFEFQATFEVVSGSDGTTAAAIAAPDLFEADVVSDLSGDGLDDVAAIGWDNGPYVRAYSGLGGAPLWTRSVEEWGWVYCSDDLDGDGLADLVYLEEGDWWDEEGGWASALHVLSGADGSTLWRRDLGNFWPVLAGDVDGDGGSEILLFGRAGGKSVTRLVRGTDGRTLRSHSQKGGSFWRAGDVNGDGVQDVVGQRKVKVKKKKVREVTVRSGRTGKVLWSKRGMGPVSALLGDLDGDGRDDLVTRSGRKYRAVNGRNGRFLWPKMVTPAGWGCCLVVASIPGGSEALLLEALDEGSPPLHTTARSGRTGALRWKRTFEL